MQSCFAGHLKALGRTVALRWSDGLPDPVNAHRIFDGKYLRCTVFGTAPGLFATFDNFTVGKSGFSDCAPSRKVIAAGYRQIVIQTARKTQYNHYRNQLLSFEGGKVEWKTLGEIASFTYGLAAKAQDFGDARFIRISDIDRNGQLIAELPKFVELDKESKRYLLKKNDLLMARTGATFGKTMIFAENYPAVFAGFLIKIDLERAINPKYYWHCAQSNFFWDQANALVSGGGQPQFNANALQSIKMPIPFPNDPERSLTEQARIVAILDKFDTLATSLAEGLPREIALRQRQYEH